MKHDFCRCHCGQCNKGRHDRCSWPKEHCLLLIKTAPGVRSVQTPDTDKTGKKFDDDKLRWDLLPLREVEDVVRVVTHGAKKYGPLNWQKLEQFEDRYYAAMMRHIAAWRMGQVLDPDTKLPHLAHAICNALFLMWNDRKNRRGRNVAQA